MKFKQIAAALPLLVVGMCNNPAHASGSVSGYVEDHYKSIITRQPSQVEVCNEVDTPKGPTVFGQGFSLDGAIIGGIIGNNVGDIENGGALGAIVGGMIGHNNSDATGGTRTVCKREIRYTEERRTIYSHSTVTFTHQGKSYTLRFQK